MYVVKHATTNQYLYEIWPAGNADFTEWPRLAREFETVEAAEIFAAVLTAALGELFVCYSLFSE